MRRSITALLVLTAASTGAVEAAYPQRPIRIISPNSAAGANDTIGRIVALKLGEVLGQQVVIDNRGGAGGIIGADIAAKATPDGYTLVLASLATHSVSPHVYRNIPYDAVRDFAAVSLFAVVQNALNANPAFAPNSVRELVALAKAKPGSINYASAGPGSASHFSGLLFAKMAGSDLVHIPYKGGAPAIAAVLSGEAGFNFGPMPAMVPLIKSGRLKALAVSGLNRSRALPEVPTVAESGVPGYSSSSWFGLMAPKGTPKAVIDILHAAVEKTIAAPDTAQQLLNVGAEPQSSTPAVFAKFVSDEYERYGRLVKEAGLKIE